MKNLLILLACLFSVCLQAQIDECTGYDELNRGRHKISGMTYGHPYTTFDRHNGLRLENTLNIIRQKIQKESNKDIRPINNAYKTVYDNANKSIPNSDDDNGLRKLIDGDFYDSEIPVWGKNNAFVFLIGLDGQGRSLDSIDPTGGLRNAFRDRALQAFDGLTGGIENMNVFTMVFHMGDMLHYAKTKTLCTAWLVAVKNLL